MKTLKLLTIIGMSTLVGLTGCKKDEPKEDVFKTPFSEESVEQNKEKIETAGVDFVNLVDDMKDVNAIEVCMSFSDLSDSEVVDGPAILMAPVETIANLDKSSPTDVLNTLKSTVEDPESFEEAWDEIVGTYSWNEDNGNWDYVAGGDEVKIMFPGKEGDITNTAVYTVNNVSFQNVDFPEFEDETGMIAQFPTSMHADLNYNGITLAAFDYSASFQSDGLPINTKVVLTVDDYYFSTEFNHKNNAEISGKYLFKKGNTKLIEIFAKVNGDWSDESIEEHVIETEEFDHIDWVTGDSVFNTEYEVEPEYIISNANAYFQVMNIKVAGLVQFDSLYVNLMDLMDSEDAYTEEDGIKLLTQIINDNAMLIVVDTDDNTKLAEAEMYAYHVTEDGSDYWTNDMRFVFADGSKIDYEDYFEEGFGGFIDALNDVVMELNDTYDLTMDPVEY